jgi:hypothetical protein
MRMATMPVTFALNLSIIFLDRDTFLRVCYFLNVRPCFYAWALVATNQLILSPLPL